MAKGFKIWFSFGSAWDWWLPPSSEFLGWGNWRSDRAPCQFGLFSGLWTTFSTDFDAIASFLSLFCLKSQYTHCWNPISRRWNEVLQVSEKKFQRLFVNYYWEFWTKSPHCSLHSLLYLFSLLCRRLQHADEVTRNSEEDNPITVLNWATECQVMLFLGSLWFIYAPHFENNKFQSKIM